MGIISAGRVGTALGEALSRCGHRVTHVVARSDESSTRARLRLADARLATVAETAAACELIFIAVPDRSVAEVASEVALHVGPGKIVVHTAGSMGRAVLDEVALTGALTIAAHPAMTFAGFSDDADRLSGCPWGVTVGDELARTVAELLIGELGGRPVFIDERHRGLYHAAMAHGSNGLGAVVVDAVEMLAQTIGASDASTPDFTDAERRRQAAALLTPLLEASLENALKWGARGLTGPVTRDDVETVVKHEAEIGRAHPGASEAYRALAARIAHMRGASGVLRHLKGWE